jgi:hypothetical protein
MDIDSHTVNLVEGISAKSPLVELKAVPIRGRMLNL